MLLAKCNLRCRITEKVDANSAEYALRQAIIKRGAGFSVIHLPGRRVIASEERVLSRPTPRSSGHRSLCARLRPTREGERQP
jgi:hypothetical protein